MLDVGGVEGRPHTQTVVAQRRQSSCNQALQ